MIKDKYKNKAIHFYSESLIKDKLQDVSVEQIDSFNYLPGKLYKYCSINEYTLMNIIEDKMYIRKFNDLDDQFEACLSICEDINKYENAVIAMLKNMRRTNNVKSVGNINIKECVTEYANALKENKNKFGCCSLSECNDSQIMWQMYANNYKGLCIEYDINSYTNNEFKRHLLPVTYQNKRKADPIRLLIDTCQIKSKNKRQSKINKWYFNLVTVKNKEWELQNEWRIIGNGNTTINAPNITKIYIGCDVTSENINLLKYIVANKNIELYSQTFDYNNMKLIFEPIERGR